jgi:formylglycine-generating enzyme required for sulfatase activity
MALIQCADCGNDVSDQAAACPKCARPISRHVSSMGKRALLLSAAGLCLFCGGVVLGVFGVRGTVPVNLAPANPANAVTEKPNVPVAPQITVGAQPGQLRNDNALATKFVWIPPGKFEMGSPPNEPVRYDNESQVWVILTKGFWLAQHEVTQSEWKSVKRNMPWSGKQNIQEGDNYPATFVNWPDAIAFCKKLTDTEHEAGRLAAKWAYTLPTEAQWEYACRAGKESIFSFGDDPSVLSRYAWWGGLVGRGSATNETYAHLVAQKAPNEWGLHDMHGNVWEWCRDRYADHLSAGPDPEGPKEGAYRVYRGGSWSDSAGYCRTARRGGDEPESRLDNLGFRLAIVEQ